MATQTESGMNTYLWNFRKLINVCTGFGSAYNPQNPALQVSALETQLADAQTSIANVDALLPTYLTAASVRQERIAIIMPLATRVQATALVLGLPSSIMTRIKEVVRKIRGKRLHNLPEKTATNNEAEQTKRTSVAQTSFNEKIERFSQLIDLVGSQPQYNPVETDLSVTAMTALLNELREANSAVMQTVVPLNSARQERDRRLYAPKTGVMDTALLVKEYVKAIFGAVSVQYREVQHIKFRNR